LDLGIKKTGILLLSLTVLVTAGFVSNQAYAECHLTDICDDTPSITVGGLPVPINESEVFGELAQQYSLWLIPSISAIGIAAFLIKRKL